MSFPPFPYEIHPFPPDWSDQKGHRVSTKELFLREAAAAPALSLYCHLPFCQTLCTFCGCQTMITKDRAQVTRYLDLIEREMLILTTREPGLKQTPITQIYWGGGSPNFFSGADLFRLWNLTREHFSVTSDVSFFIEWDARDLSKDQVAFLGQVKPREIKWGIVDSNPKVLELIHREARREEPLDPAGLLDAPLVIDLVMGLPGQTEESWRETLERALLTNPAGFQIEVFRPVPWIKPHQRLYTEEQIPSLQDLKGWWQWTEEALAHFNRWSTNQWRTLPREDLKTRHISGFCRAQERTLLGIGVGALSESKTRLAQSPKNFATYERDLISRKIPYGRGHERSSNDLLWQELRDVVLSAPDKKILEHLERYFSETGAPPVLLTEALDFSKTLSPDELLYSFHLSLAGQK